MVKRPTGQTAAADVNVELQIMMSLEALLDPKSPKPATIPGYGSLPADIARDIVITRQGRKWWRRLFTAPSGVRGKSGPARSWVRISVGAVSRAGLLTSSSSAIRRLAGVPSVVRRSAY